jgi:tetratricopeptide (TPR) repeat protein
MSRGVWLLRRFGVATAGIALSGVLMRGQLSAALVSRGDDMLYRSDTMRALAFYRRALVVDRGDSVAVDRYLFVVMLTHRKGLVERGIELASAYLHSNPRAAAVLMDRAMCEHLLGRDRAAQNDFTLAGRLGRDPRALVFAGYSALHRGRRSEARVLWREALALNAGYFPALRALRIR